MSIEYIYKVFLVDRMSDTEINVSIANSEDIYYLMSFIDKEECSNYLRVLHNLAKEMSSNQVEISKQKELIKEFILDNPFNYEYGISTFYLE